VDRCKVLPVTRAWQAISMLNGTDSSWGIVEGMARILGFPVEELGRPNPFATAAAPGDG